MFIYNVTVKVANEIAADWLLWMKTEHMQDLVDTGLFIDSRICRLLEQDDSEGPTYVAQYFCDSMDDYQDYIRRHADVMREKGFAKWGNKTIAFRSLMQVEG